MSFFESFQESKDFSPPFISGYHFNWEWHLSNEDVSYTYKPIPGVMLINTIGKDTMTTNKPCYHMYGLTNAKTNTYERIGTGSITNSTGGTVDVSAYEVVGLKYNDADFSVELGNVAPLILATTSTGVFTGDAPFVFERTEYVTWQGDDISGMSQDDIPYLKLTFVNDDYIPPIKKHLNFSPENPYDNRTEYTLYSSGDEYVKVSGLRPGFSSMHIKYCTAYQEPCHIEAIFSNQPIT